MSTDTCERLHRLASRPWASLCLSETEQAIRRAGLEDEQPEGILVALLLLMSKTQRGKVRKMRLR